jgi:predicted RNA-binding protein with PIN domain
MMTNKIIIDAWNVIWKIPSLSRHIPNKLEDVRSKFNMIIKNYYSGKNVDYRIVYDGQPFMFSGAQKQNSKVSFSRNPEKADDLIIKLIEKQQLPRDWTVITSDRHLTHRAKNIGAHILSSESFIQKINKYRIEKKKSGKSDPQVKKEDISYWLNKFDSSE